jgi:hypothetical protein
MESEGRRRVVTTVYFFANRCRCPWATTAHGPDIVCGPTWGAPTAGLGRIRLDGGKVL